jgi:phosphoglycerate dehydrogenase-like enzyme
MEQRFVVWSNVAFGPATAASLGLLTDTLGGHTLRVVDRDTAAADARAWLEDATVAFGQPPVDALISNDRLRWIELSSAGYERYDRSDLRDAFAARGVAMTNASGVYADACAQHVLAMMLSACRGLPAALEAARDRRWAFAELRPHMRRLDGHAVLMLGWGSIARRLAELLAPFGVHVTATRRRITGTEVVRTVPVHSLDDELARTDHLVNLLPGGSRTARFVDAVRLASLRPGAWFYNVGRGSTVDQPALIAALESGRLAGAWLDVTDPEPLPPDHPLWRAPNCFITPHLAGGQADETGHQVRHFLENFSRFTAGGDLIDRIW